MILYCSNLFQNVFTIYYIVPYYEKKHRQAISNIIYCEKVWEEDSTVYYRTNIQKKEYSTCTKTQLYGKISIKRFRDNLWQKKRVVATSIRIVVTTDVKVSPLDLIFQVRCCTTLIQLVTKRYSTVQHRIQWKSWKKKYVIKIFIDWLFFLIPNNLLDEPFWVRTYMDNCTYDTLHTN